LVYVKWGPNLRAMLKLDGPSKAAAPVATPAEEQKPKPETSPTPEATTTAATPQPSPSPETAGANDKSGEAQPDTAKTPAAVTTDSSSSLDKTKTDDVSSPAAKNAAKKDKTREEPSLKPSPTLLKAQDYLQGRNGVKQDCEQGLTYLRAAVQRSEPAAAMQMGELYASGHCVQQDRVMGYRWMNSAREKAPGNTAIQMTMDTLWGRMTAEERKEAGH
jgi:TPR repeat protein